MTLKQLAGMGIAAILLAAGAANANSGITKVVRDGNGLSVKNGLGDCVKSEFGFSPEGCETAPPPPAPAAAPAPAPAPAPVIAPAPAPAPRAVVPAVPKPKAKGNYKGKVEVDPASREALQKYQR